VNTVGKKLAQERKKRRLSIEDVARITKIRPERVVDLEADDYSRFPSTTYAKGFLLIYGRYLGVDVSESSENFGDTHGKIRVDDYEYLSNAPKRRAAPVRLERKKRSLRPLLVFAVAFSLAFVLLYWLLNFQRLGSLSALAERGLGRGNSAPQATPVIESKIAATAPAETPEAAPVSTPAMQQLSIHPTKKIWVTIRKDSPDSSPIFEDWLYPDAHPLMVRGEKFWIEAQEKDALEIRRDGAIVPSTDSLVTVE
jgi:cytoskeleton protein RodZ